MVLEDDIAFWTATRQAKAIREGKITSRALLELFVSRIERLNPALNAIVTLDLQHARLAADAADAKVAAGEPLGPLHGLPITIKDALQTAGIQSTGGATELQKSVPDQDAPVVQAVKQAGAIVFGKSNLPRWSGDLQSYNDMFGTTVNPWDPERVPGGSSGGAAAAVATGLTAFEIGTDIGGSIRYPAAFCGIFGHKPSFGVVPSRGYIDHESGGNTEADINVVGPLARSAEDLELLLNVLLKKQGPLVAVLNPPPKNVSELRVAAWLDDPFCPVGANVSAVLERAVGNLEAAGIPVDRDARPDVDPQEASSLGMWLVTSAVLQSMPAETLESIGRESAAPQTSHRDWLDKHARREAIRLKWEEFFRCYDAIIMPISPVAPFPHDQQGNVGTRVLISDGEARPYLDLIRWTTLTGMAYLPATTPPVGFDRDGLPVSFQVVGPYGGDYTTIRLAQMISQVNGGCRRPPAG